MENYSAVIVTINGREFYTFDAKNGDEAVKDAHRIAKLEKGKLVMVYDGDMVRIGR